MDPNKSAIERAFELARSGRFEGTDNIKDQLKHEGYSQDQLFGSALLKQLRGLIREAKRTAKQSIGKKPPSHM
jgi:hypothetical protein